MSTQLPPPPYPSKMLTDQGMLAPIWAGWIRDLFRRTGGTVAQANDELAARFPVGSVDIGAGAVISGKIGAAAVAFSNLALDARTGLIVQDVLTLSSAAATGTTTIPLDDTIPQITEGTEFLTATITPTNVANRLIIEAVLHISSDTGSRHLIGALFQGAGANALAVSSAFMATAAAFTVLVIRHEMAAGTTSATTFRIRAGTDAAATVTLNGLSSVRKFGGATLSAFRVTERIAA